jgi:hypothetical protein
MPEDELKNTPKKMIICFDCNKKIFKIIWSFLSSLCYVFLFYHPTLVNWGRGWVKMLLSRIQESSWDFSRGHHRILVALIWNLALVWKLVCHRLLESLLHHLGIPLQNRLQILGTHLPYLLNCLIGIREVCTI